MNRYDEKMAGLCVLHQKETTIKNKFYLQKNARNYTGVMKLSIHVPLEYDQLFHGPRWSCVLAGFHCQWNPVNEWAFVRAIEKWSIKGWSF